MEEEADEVVPEGVEEVELARIKLEQAQRECRLLFRDLRTLRHHDLVGDMRTINSPLPEEGALWMISSARSALARKLELEFAVKCKARKAARVALRFALQHAAQQQLMAKEKNRSPSAAMRISWAFDKLVWSMLCDGESFAEAEINNMILNVDRDFKDIGVARFTIKSFVVKNGLARAKSKAVLSAWNPPAEWGRNSMLRVDAKQGAPKDGRSPLLLFEVDIYPLRIHLTETMYAMMWEYLFPEDEQDVKRQEVWRVSTAAVTKRGGRRATAVTERSSLEASAGGKISLSGSGLSLVPHALHGEHSRADFLMAAQTLEVTKSQQLRKSTTAAGIVEQGQTSSSDRLEDMEVDMTTEEMIVKSHRQGSSLRNSSSSTPRHDVPPMASTTTSNGPTTSAEVGGSIKSKERRPSKFSKASSQEEKKESSTRNSFLEFHNIKISQVVCYVGGATVTYEGSRFAVSDLRLLMDTFTRVELTGSWRRLFSKVKKHIIWSVLKSVTGMQGKKFKDKLPAQGQADDIYPDSDSNSSDSTGSHVVSGEQFPIKHRKQSDRAGEGFVSSIRGLFNSQRRKAKALVLRTMRGPDGLEDLNDSSSEDEAAISKSPRGHGSISKAKRLLQRQARKLRPPNRPKGNLGEQLRLSQGASPSQSEADLSDASSTYKDFE